MLVTTTPEKAEEHQVLEGDLIFTPSSETVEEIGVSALVDEFLPNTCFSYHVLRFQFKRNVVKNYKKYLCNNHYVKNYFSKKASGSIRKTLNRDDFKEAKVILPSISTQQRIADYLDKHCAEIDVAIEKTMTTIDEYKKLKQSIITEAVTKGLNPNVTMKDSGIEWIGKIPEHWQLKQFRHILQERNEKNSPIKSTERLSLSIDLGVTLYSEKTTNLDRYKDDFEQYKLAYEGDLVMNSMNMIVGATGVSEYFGCISPAYYTFYDNSNDHATAKFCEHIFRSKTMMRVLFSMGKGIYAIQRGDDRINTCRLKVSKDDLKSMILPIPSIQEQREILKHIEKQYADIDNIIAKKQTIITELESYKKSLIYECVTGKKEV